MASNQVTLKLSEAEVTLLMSALHTVEPTGGGSPEKVLQSKVADQSGIISDIKTVQKMGKEVITSFLNWQLEVSESPEADKEMERLMAVANAFAND